MTLFMPDRVRCFSDAALAASLEAIHLELGKAEDRVEELRQEQRAVTGELQRRKDEQRSRSEKP